MFWDLLFRIMSFREVRMMQRMAQAFKTLPCLLAKFKFKEFGAGFMAVVELIGALFFAMPQTPRGQKINLDEWRLVWSDEFGGDSLNPANWAPTWNYQRRGGYWHDGQNLVYDGCLRIRTEHKTTELGTG